MATTLELLPNEILISCFEYLNALDIVYGFSRLNKRFDQLIFLMRLHFDFREISKSKFDQLCNEIALNEQIKQKIYSIKLSNQNTCFQIRPFLSRFSLNQFPHLRSLTFVESTEDNISTVLSILPSLSELSCFHLLDQNARIQLELPLTQVRILTAPSVLYNNQNICDMSSIRNLTISRCNWSEFNDILNKGVQLRYLNVHISSELIVFHITDSYKNCAVHLKELTITTYSFATFTIQAMILKQTPNLKTLTMYHAHCVLDMFDAMQWRHFITDSLPSLQTFQFYFKYSTVNDFNDIDERLAQFQSDFWQKEHRWFVEYSLTQEIAEVYTTPFVFDRYKLPLHPIRYYTEVMNHSDTFKNVTDLTIEPFLTRENLQYYFPHLTSLSIGHESSRQYKIRRHDDFIESLKIIVNLSNLQQLDLAYVPLKNASMLLEILRHTPELNSIGSNLRSLVMALDNEELNTYFNKLIKKLQIYGTPYSDSYHATSEDQMSLICSVFQNIEHLVCKHIPENVVLFLLKNLSKLSRLTVVYGRLGIGSLQIILKEIGFNVDTITIHSTEDQTSLWIPRDIQS